MKTIAALLLTGLLALGSARGETEETSEAPAESRPDLVVHEWGTFTQVVGSDGGSIPWWTPYLEGPAALPEFVKPLFRINGGKGARTWLSRMETPVLYFYADRPARLEIGVDETRIPFTEVYPNVVTSFPILPANRFPADAPPQVQRWDIEILPPSDPVGEAMPEVGSRGAHYRHAREVPEAWWVRNANPESKGSEVEKFVFYRGAGDVSMPSRISRIGEDSVLLHSGSRSCFLVEIEPGGTLRWTRAETASDTDHREVPLPSVDRGALTDRTALALALEGELATAGLTREEARAMVATWEEAWLAETGLRLLEVLPRSWIDRTLPLSISPVPAAIERVFVARWELLTPSIEKDVMTLLEGPGSVESKMAELERRDLGRFGTAVFDRVAQLRDWQFRSTYRSEIVNLMKPEEAP